MNLEQCNGNYNHMYEFLLNDVWYPCHIYSDIVYESGITIFTRNGGITSVPDDRVRKMSKDTYLKNRKEVIDNLREYAYERGFHESVEEDIRLFEESNELELIRLEKV